MVVVVGWVGSGNPSVVLELQNKTQKKKLTERGRKAVVYLLMAW